MREVVEKINERLVNTIKEVIEKYSLHYEIKELREVGENHYLQTIMVYYKDFSKKIVIEYHCYMDRVKIVFDWVKICDRKIKNYTNKALEKIENEIKVRAMWLIEGFIKECKEREEIQSIENNLAEIFKITFGMKPDRVSFYRSNFVVVFAKENSEELFKIVIHGVIENNTVKVREIKILDDKGNTLPFYLEQIAELFKMMTICLF